MVIIMKHPFVTGNNQFILIVICAVLLAACQTMAMDSHKHTTSPNIKRVLLKEIEATNKKIYQETEDKNSENFYVCIKTRPSISQNFILTKPKYPVACVILFAGGSGMLHLEESFGKLTMSNSKYNFLIRSRSNFSSHGFIVASVDAPSDRKNGMFNGFRNSSKHLKDIEAVISYLKNEADVPVWMVGTSRGTESATYIAIHTKAEINGLILTSSMTVPNKKGEPVISLDLAQIKVPVLVVSHKNDKCKVTPPIGAEQIAARLINAPKVEVKYFDGGHIAKSGSCNALSAHGFYGIEKEVVDYIAKFIKSNSK